MHISTENLLLHINMPSVRFSVRIITHIIPYNVHSCIFLTIFLFGALHFFFPLTRVFSFLLNSHFYYVFLKLKCYILQWPRRYSCSCNTFQWKVKQYYTLIQPVCKKKKLPWIQDCLSVVYYQVTNSNNKYYYLGMIMCALHSGLQDVLPCWPQVRKMCEVFYIECLKICVIWLEVSR